MSLGLSLGLSLSLNLSLGLSLSLCLSLSLGLRPSLSLGLSLSLSLSLNLSIRRTKAVLKLTEWLGLNEAGIKVFVDNDRNEKKAAATGQGIMGMLTWCEEILKEKSSVARLQCLIYCRLGQRFVRRQLCCWGGGGDYFLILGRVPCSSLLLEIEPRFLGGPAPSLFNLVTEIYVNQNYMSSK